MTTPGRTSVQKGKAFERRVAAEIRAAVAGPYPAADVRRSSQADRAGNSDVHVDGHPVLSALWLELTDARAPDPLAKLAQAERDVAAAGGGRWPVVVWHRLGARSTQATLRLETLLWALGEDDPRIPRDALATVVELDWHEFLAMVVPGPA